MVAAGIVTAASGRHAYNTKVVVSLYKTFHAPGYVEVHVQTAVSAIHIKV